MGSPIRLLGFDVGGTKCAAVVGDRRGRVIERIAWPSLAERGPEPMIGDLLEAGRRLLERHATSRAVGVSIGGPLDSASGVVHEPPNLPGWRAVPLRDRLAEAFGLPVAVEHDAAACALAEQVWGAGRGVSRLGFLTCGSGFGLGLVFDGAPYRGAGGRSIEIGHVRYRDEGPEAFGKRGSFEAYAAGNALPALAAWLFPDRFSTRTTGASIAELARAGDPEAARVVELNAQAVGDACAMVGDLLGLELVVLGSLARHLGRPWVELVRRRFREQVLPEVAARCRVVPAGLGEELQDRASLVVARRAAALRR